MKPLLAIAGSVALVAILLLACYELLALFTQPDKTITQLVRRWAARNPLPFTLMVLVAGVLIGHFSPH